MHHQAKSATLHRSPLRPQLNQWVEERQFWEQQRLRRAQIVDTLAALVAQHTSTSRTNRGRVEGSSICACYMCQFGRTKTCLSPFLPQKGCRQNFETHEVSFCKRPAIESVTLHAFSKQNTLFLYQPSLNFKQRKICFCYKICIVAKSARKCIIAKSASPSPLLLLLGPFVADPLTPPLFGLRTLHTNMTLHSWDFAHASLKSTSVIYCNILTCI